MMTEEQLAQRVRQIAEEIEARYPDYDEDARTMLWVKEILNGSDKELIRFFLKTLNDDVKRMFSH